MASTSALTGSGARSIIWCRFVTLNPLFRPGQTPLSSRLLQLLQRLNMTHLLYNQYISGTKILEIGGKVVQYSCNLCNSGLLNEMISGHTLQEHSSLARPPARA